MGERKTIGLFIDTFYPMVDGVVSVVNNLATALSKHADVIVFAPNCSKEKYDDSKFNYKVVRCKSIKLPIVDYSLPLPNLDRKFMKELKKYNLDVVHIHSPFSLGKVGIKYAKKHGAKLLATMHSQYKQDFLRAVKFKWLANILTRIIIKEYNKCDECFAVNSEVARIFYEDYHYKKMPTVMNNATEMVPVKDVVEAREKINNLHGLTDDEKIFLFVGRINALKNIFFTAKSLKIIKEKNPELKFKMLFVGDGQDKEKLEEWIKQNDMEDKIIMCGKVTDRELLAKYYSRADLFLFPSLYDASSIVQIEAASQKTPSVFIEGAATTATITNRHNGFIAKNNEEDFANLILEILNNNELYNTVSENCFKEIYKTWDDNVNFRLGT